MPVTLRAREATDDVLEEYAKRHGTTVAKLLGSDSNDSNSAQAQVKEKEYDVGRAMASEELDKREKRILKLKKEHERLKRQRKQQQSRKRVLAGSVLAAVPATIAASVLYDKFRKKK